MKRFFNIILASLLIIVTSSGGYNGKWVRQGQSPTSTILYNIDGNWIREGSTRTGRILYNIN